MALMLIRKKGQSIKIGDDIIITVAESGHQVKLAIDAPREIVVVRTELLQGESDE